MVASKVTVGRETPRQFVTAPRLQRCLGFSRVSRHVVILSGSTTRQAVFISHSHTEKALVPKVVSPWVIAICPRPPSILCHYLIFVSSCNYTLNNVFYWTNRD